MNKEKLTSRQAELIERLGRDRLYIEYHPDAKLWIGGGPGPDGRTVRSLVDRGIIALVDCGLTKGARVEVTLV